MVEPAPPTQERLTAVEWAKRLQLNQVQAERSAMYAGKRYATMTEAEFIAMLRESRA